MLRSALSSSMRRLATASSAATRLCLNRRWMSQLSSVASVSACSLAAASTTASPAASTASCGSALAGSSIASIHCANAPPPAHSLNAALAALRSPRVMRRLLSAGAWRCHLSLHSPFLPISLIRSASGYRVELFLISTFSGLLGRNGPMSPLAMRFFSSSTSNSTPPSTPPTPLSAKDEKDRSLAISIVRCLVFLACSHSARLIHIASCGIF